MPDRARELSLPAPADERRHILTVVPEDVPDPSERAWPGIVALRCADVVRQVQGRVLCLFSSPMCLELAWRQLRRAGRPLLCEGVTAPAELACAFREQSTSVLLATSSGFETLGLQDTSCDCLLMDRLPFPLPTDPVLDAFKERDISWFVHHSLPAAVSVFKRHLGRLRRGRNIVVVLDPRIVRRPYGRLFLEGTGDRPVSRSIADIARFLNVGRKEDHR